MANMGYCRFQNTEKDLRDCLDSILDGDELSEEEEEAKNSLVDICQEILDATSDS